MKLTEAQSELVAAMKRGTVVKFTPGFDAHWFRFDKKRRVTMTVNGLIHRGIAYRNSDDMLVLK